MTQLFDNYDKNYSKVVQSSIDFSGLPHSFFMAAKVDVLRDLIASRLVGNEKPAALDVGCGVGEFHPYLRGMFSRLCGTDVSSASVEQARQNNPEVEYKAYEGTLLPYENGTFDLVTTVCVMHHVPPVEWPGFVSEMRRVLRPGGLACVIEHNPFNPLTRLTVARCEFDKDAVLLRAHQTQDLLKEAGYRDIDTRYFLLLPGAAPMLRRIEAGLRRLPFGAQYATFATA